MRRPRRRLRRPAPRSDAAGDDRAVADGVPVLRPPAIRLAAGVLPPSRRRARRGNLLLIAFLGRLAEPNFSTRSYAAFFVGVAITSVSGGFLAIALFDRGPVVAYGASGLGFALAGYSLQYLRGIDRPVLRGGATSSLSSAEWLAVIVGLAAVFTVALDVGTGPFFDAYWLNGAHAVGLVVGLLVGWYAPPSRHPSV
ncbi:hypothetical protein VB773_04560 [Haloarculaceae archaeon H-GB2-1]|nr:hypothetical protein [Haloarculaceae archaeon H-GB11]MEA5406924.1 hypothetical protein [Haloarculaceae archaeon H-GB2-1]